ncbi:ATP-grasp domain-containing protein [Nocardiopsis sp. NPDC101807]|uniref:ATP-grasp domain-containing protein n=1 Tax=Nocardiopsis sp. NPDC101807 TaxID=3364339 RepID=UPI003818D228
MKILIIDAFSSGKHLAHELVRRGALVLHARSMEDPPAYLATHYPQGFFTKDFGHLPEYELIDELSRAPVDHVLAGTETGVELAERIAGKFGLPTNEPLLPGARRNKQKMAQYLGEAGLDHARSVVVRSAEEAEGEYRAHFAEGRVMVKPTSSAATDGVRMCLTAGEVVKAVEDIFSASANVLGYKNTHAMIQEYLPGEEYCVNTVSDQGSHTVVELWRYSKTVGPSQEPVYDFEELVPRGSDRAGAVLAYCREVLTALGVRNGPAHTEIMLTPRGPVLVDLAARLGGAQSPHVLEEYLGTSHVGATADWITSRGRATIVPPPAGEDTNLLYMNLINRRPGRVRGTGWIQAYRRLGGVVEVASSCREGDFLPVTRDLVTSPGFVYLSGSAADIDRSYRRIRELEDNGIYTDLV